MNVVKIFLSSIIYVVWAVLIGFFVPVIAGWSTIIAALAAGIYVGYKSKPEESFLSGLMAGLVGGVLGSLVINYFPSVAGIPVRVYPSEIISPALETIQTNFPWVSEITLVIIGAIFGGIGAIIGSMKKLGKVFLFLTLFVLFIFYGAIDNVAWNWTTPGWTWNTSVSHVLTNQIDLFVAVVFAAFTTLLALILFR